jgi:dihydroorotase
MKVKAYNGAEIDFPDLNLDNNDLLALPAVIDPHVHFRTPGAENKENWISGAQAALAGGVTTVFDMPNNNPAVTSLETLVNKEKLVAEQLQTAGIPLRPYFYFGATNDNLDEFEKVKDKIIGVKIFFGSSTGNLLVTDSEIQEQIFKKCAELNLIVAVHAEDEELLLQEKAKYPNPTIFDHSKIRSKEVAIKAVKQALLLAKKTGAKLYLLHISTRAELELIRQAKSDGVKVFAETAPHYLFLDESYYDLLGSKAQMNPPLREASDVHALWQALVDGMIDTIGTDHAPHTLQEKSLPYPQSPSGVPGIETSLPLLLNAYNEGKISLAKIVELTSLNQQRIFNLPNVNDWVIVDLKKEKVIKDNELKTKCGWSPYSGRKLTGAIVATIIDGQVFVV